jgi:hypothetical protein
MDTGGTRTPGRAVAAMLAAALALGACTAGSATDAETQDRPVDVGGPPTAAVTTPPATAEEQATAALEQLVRDYYAAENAVFLDPASDPSAALDPYLRNPASAARVADVLSFRNAGHTLESSTAVVHSVAVTQLDLSADPASATIEECHTLAATGTDGETGEPASFESRGPITWDAVAIGDGSWRLKSYVTGAEGSC